MRAGRCAFWGPRAYSPWCPMRVLMVVTKAPVPPADGGRLAVFNTLEALSEAGVDVTLVAPIDPRRPLEKRWRDALNAVCRPVLVPAPVRSFAALAPLALFTQEPLTLLRHRLPAVRATVDRLLAQESFDVAHAEQIHALAQVASAARAGVPVVHRAQNVESDLWSAAAEATLLARPWLRAEARRMARQEARAVHTSCLTIALTRPDADRLSRISGAPERVIHVPVPFPGALPAGSTVLPGEPAIVLLASGGWRPNEVSTRWFLEEVWPVVFGSLPGARLHVLGNLRHSRPSPGVCFHGAPQESQEAFAPGSILAVPLRWGSGVRMRILEAWARGIAVVTTPQGEAGLGARDGTELLLARTPPEFALAFRRLAEAGPLTAQLLAAGRAHLLAQHAPARVAAQLLGVYDRAKQLAGQRQSP
jgi:glycosyltransferase involved in cell wall biosynthesis